MQSTFRVIKGILKDLNHIQTIHGIERVLIFENLVTKSLYEYVAFYQLVLTDLGYIVTNVVPLKSRIIS